MLKTASAYLVVLAIVDALIPLPIVALILLYVVWRRPRWFSDLVRELYSQGGL